MTEVSTRFQGPISVGILELDGKPHDHSWQFDANTFDASDRWQLVRTVGTIPTKVCIVK